MKIEDIKRSVGKHPISVYIGAHPKGEWIFIEYFEGTYGEALELASWYQGMIPRTGKQSNSFRIWRND